jgi:hypothetical protein
MRKRFNRFALPIAMLAVALSASSIMAATPKKVTGVVSGGISKSNLTPGACPAVVDVNGTHSYDTTCGHPGSCQCISASGLTLAGGFGKGTVNLSVTVDEDSTAITGLSTDLNACAPAFGVFTLTIPAKGKIAGRTQTLNAMGAVCGTAGTTTVVALGGFSVESSTASTSGSGTFNGTVSTVGSVSVKLIGLIANP